MTDNTIKGETICPVTGEGSQRENMGTLTLENQSFSHQAGDTRSFWQTWGHACGFGAGGGAYRAPRWWKVRGPELSGKAWLPPVLGTAFPSSGLWVRYIFRSPLSLPHTLLPMYMFTHAYTLTLTPAWHPFYCCSLPSKAKRKDQTECPKLYIHMTSVTPCNCPMRRISIV